MKKQTELEITPAEEVGGNLPAVNNFDAQALIKSAIENKVDIGTMERLLAMRREIKAEFAKEEYDKAMAAFQSDCPIIKKTKPVKNDTGKVLYNFAPIESIVAQVKDLIKKHGFSYTTNQKLEGDKVTAFVKVIHDKGHSEITDMTVPLGTKTAIMSASQVVSGATTFAKRIAFCNAFGILTGDEDNDAALSPIITDEQYKALKLRLENGEDIWSAAKKNFVLTKEQIDELSTIVNDYLRSLYLFKKDLLTEEQRTNFERIIYNGEENRYSKVRRELDKIVKGK